MNVSVFPVSTTNIFPLANDTKGGQLMTEYNLKARESVGTWEDVQYSIGPSFTHSQSDFKVTNYTDSVGTIISNTTLQIASGRAVVDGHAIESLAPVLIDLAELNAQAALEGTDALKGKLCVGLRAMYSTEQTMAGALRPYNSDMIYEGIQVVVLPKDKFKLPVDEPNLQDEVTAHLKLAELEYANDKILNIVDNYPDRIRYISSERIANVDSLISDVYITKTGLKPKALYTFSTKSSDPETGPDTWCDTTDSLIVWDRAPTLTTDVPATTEATFGVDLSGKTQLYLPHKQVPYEMTDTNGTRQYYQEKVLDLPLANYAAGTSGTVDRTYTNSIKAISEKLNNIYKLPNGRQVGYISVLNDVADLPEINTNWKIGDYILVGQDNTVDASADSIRPPATMYVLLPGIVKSYRYHSVVRNSKTVPSSITGICLEQTIMYGTNGNVVNTDDPDVYGEYFDLSPMYHGEIDKDYFTITYKETEDAEDYSIYYFVVASYEDESIMYSDAVHVTGQIGLATEDTIGGFLNVPETALDGGYIFRDETGHLRLLDYNLLRSGVLAYQLGEDFEMPVGITFEEVQSNLDEYVNERVAFANTSQTENSSTPDVINITMDLSADEDAEDPTLNIYDIDSRFNTSIYLHINGTPGDNLTINIVNCQKIRIDSNIPDGPTINLYNSCLYYDSAVLDRLNIIRNMSLWYEQFDESDPNLLVDNMTIRAIDEPIITENMDYWSTAAPNDNHYLYALHSITFAPNGEIVGAGLYVKNETTANIAEGISIITSKFTLPQGAGLTYPKSRLTRKIKISGQFISAYNDTASGGYRTIDTKFTALTNITSEYDPTDTTDGVIAFYSDVKVITAIAGLDPSVSLDCWEPNTYYVFTGVAI